MNAQTPDVRPVVFNCEGVLLHGMLHEGAPSATTGVLVIVGGPQYRVGSHRQFVLLGRALAERGYPVLRFDYRGLGDSDGEPHTFETIDADIRAAIDAFTRLRPGLERVVVWGLCDAASAALFYGATDHRVGFKAYNLDSVLDGDLDAVIGALVTADEAERMAEAGQETA